MGRQRSIDRDKVLDTAEEIVATGAAGLTIDAVAKAMGIPRAGCSIVSAAKTPLSMPCSIAGAVPTRRCSRRSPATSLAADRRAGAYALATHSSDQTSSAKAAGLMATLIQTPEHLASTREWYRSRIAGLI